MEKARAQWAARVRRWRESDLTTREFADSIGVNPSTLTYWGWRLKREEKQHRSAAKRRRLAVADKKTKFVEVVTPVDDGRLELDLGNGRRLFIPSCLDPAALERLLAILAR